MDWFNSRTRARSLRALERELNTVSGSVRKGIDMLAGSALVGAGRSGEFSPSD